MKEEDPEGYLRQASGKKEAGLYVEKEKRSSYPKTISSKSWKEKSLYVRCATAREQNILRQIRREVNLVANGKIQHVIRADRHCGDRTRLERIGFA